jgi:hypothetical protein
MTHVFLIAAGVIVALVVAASIFDGYLGLVATLVSDAFGALRRLVQR